MFVDVRDLSGVLKVGASLCTRIKVWRMREQKRAYFPRAIWFFGVFHSFLWYVLDFFGVMDVRAKPLY